MSLIADPVFVAICVAEFSMPVSPGTKAARLLFISLFFLSNLFRAEDIWARLHTAILRQTRPTMRRLSGPVVGTSSSLIRWESFPWCLRDKIYVPEGPSLFLSYGRHAGKNSATSQKMVLLSWSYHKARQLSDMFSKLDCVLGCIQKLRILFRPKTFLHYFEWILASRQ